MGAVGVFLSALHPLDLARAQDDPLDPYFREWDWEWSEEIQMNVIRLSGVDRYATAAEVARRTFPGGAETVFLATGTDFADALAGGGTGLGPILLTRPDRLPDVTRNAIVSLSPDRVVVLGGTSAVSDDVVRAVEAL